MRLVCGKLENRVDAGTARRSDPDPPSRGTPVCGVESRALYSSAERQVLEVIVPASGLVTALEPVLTACDGTWIAHGSGNADIEVVDKDDRLRVPPDRSSLYVAAGVAKQRGRRRILLRLCQRRSLAALSYRAHASHFSRRGLAVLSGCEPQVCSGGDRGDRGHAQIL